MPDDTKNAPARNLQTSRLRNAKMQASDGHDSCCNYIENDDHGFLQSPRIHHGQETPQLLARTRL
jgi:hypothetical protein